LFQKTSIRTPLKDAKNRKIETKINLLITFQISCRCQNDSQFLQKTLSAAKMWW